MHEAGDVADLHVVADGERQFVNHLACGRCQNVRPDDSALAGNHHDGAVGGAVCSSAIVVDEVELPHVDIVSECRFGLGDGEASVGKLRVGKRAPGHQQIGAAFTGEEHVAYGANAVVARGMGKAKTCRHIACGVDRFHAGSAPAIDAYPGRPNLDAERLEPETVGVCSTTYGEKNRFGSERVLDAFDGGVNSLGRLVEGDASGLGAEVKVDTLGSQCCGEHVCESGFIARQKACAVVQQGGCDAEAIQRLGHLDADGSTAKDDDARWR